MQISESFSAFGSFAHMSNVATLDYRQICGPHDNKKGLHASLLLQTGRALFNYLIIKDLAEMVCINYEAITVRITLAHHNLTEGLLFF
jgi:hypothetical protein